MNKILILALVSLLVVSCASNDIGSTTDGLKLKGGRYAKEANENPFFERELNPKYVGEVTALLGVVVGIKSTTKNRPVYKLDIGLDHVNDIWVTSIGRQPDGGITFGDAIAFTGYISESNVTDPSGELLKLTDSRMILLAVRAQRAVR